MSGEYAAQQAAEPGVADAPVGESHFHLRFDIGICDGFLSNDFDAPLVWRPVVLVVLYEPRDPSRQVAVVSAAVKTYVSHKCVSGVEAEASGAAYGESPTNVPGDWATVEVLQAWEDAAVFYVVEELRTYAFESFCARREMQKMPIPSVAPRAPAPSGHEGGEVE